jgi:two-component system heavy metal sensor histidine kinase CusS
MPSLPRRNFHWNSLRTRLTMWNTSVVLIAVLVALLAVREGLRFYLIAELDAVLDDEVKVLVLSIEQAFPDRQAVIAEMERVAEGHKLRGWHIRWLDIDHETTIYASDLAPDKPATQLGTSFRAERVWTTATHRAVERQVAHRGIPGYYLRVGAPTAFVDEDIGRLTRIAAPVGLALLLLAPIGGYLLADRAVEPLQQIIAAAERLRPSRLEERLQIRGVGDELDQLALKINQFLDQIAEHLRQQRDFVANAAHELRSPLTAIQASAEVTLEKPRTTAEYEDLLVSVNDECQHLGHLVNQLLQLTETDGAPSHALTQMVPLHDVVRRAVEMFGPIAEDRGVALHCGVITECEVRGNPQQLRQLITNLVDNALKFTPRGGTVGLSIVRGAGDHAVVEVRDTGIGIPLADLPRIFERFYQVDKARSRAGEHRGNGLGLSICQAIAQLHGGSITVQSEPGRGTMFRVTLPTQ